MPEQKDLAPLFARFENDRKPGASSESGDVAAVLGIPFLAQLAFRVIAGAGGEDVISNQTTLLRKLTDITIRDADRPSDRPEHTKVLQRITGEELRVLLRRTAAEMSIAGKENLSRTELHKRLRTEDLDDRLRQATKDHVLTALMVSFYFKGGNAALGCEFTHKALREYLFAEEIVEALRSYGQATTGPGLPEREPYWKDFEPRDSRYKLTRDLANLLGPQWLPKEVVYHIKSLLEWEIARSSPDPVRAEAGMTPLSVNAWQCIRDGLADAWDWWCEGVLVRPQIRIDPDTDKPGWTRCLAEKIVDRNTPLEMANVGGGAIPVRFTNIDSHLGDALALLTAVVHYHVAGKLRLMQLEDKLQSRPRGQYQSIEGSVRFRPGGARGEYFCFYCARINAAGWYPAVMFPASLFFRAVDLRNASAPCIAFAHADLREVDLREATLLWSVFLRANLADGNLSKADLTGSDLSDADLTGANLTDADLTRANLMGADLTRANLSNADLTGANLSDADLFGANLTGADLTGANLTGANLTRANLTRANLDDANLTGANLSKALLTNAEITGRDKLKEANLSEA